MNQDEETKSLGEESPLEPPPTTISDQPPLLTPLKPPDTDLHPSPPESDEAGEPYLEFSNSIFTKPDLEPTKPMKETYFLEDFVTNPTIVVSDQRVLNWSPIVKQTKIQPPTPIASSISAEIAVNIPIIKPHCNYRDFHNDIDFTIPLKHPDLDFDFNNSITPSPPLSKVKTSRDFQKPSRIILIDFLRCLKSKYINSIPLIEDGDDFDEQWNYSSSLKFDSNSSEVPDLVSSFPCFNDVVFPCVVDGLIGHTPFDPGPLLLSPSTKTINFTIANKMFDQMPNRDCVFLYLPREVVITLKTENSRVESELISLLGYGFMDTWTVTVASVGNSRCILDTRGGVVSLLTVDHRLEENVEERERVTSSGGEVGRLNVFGGNAVGPLRCWPGGLCLSRSIGDTDVGEYIVPIPHVKQVKLSNAGGRLIIASEGIWDTISNDTAAMSCRGLPAELAAKLVVKEALRSRGLKDNTTFLVVDIIPSDHPVLPPTPRKKHNMLTSLFFGKKSENSTNNATSKLSVIGVVEELFEEGSAMLIERFGKDFPFNKNLEIFYCAICQVDSTNDEFESLLPLVSNDVFDLFCGKCVRDNGGGLLNGNQELENSSITNIYLKSCFRESYKPMQKGVLFCLLDGTNHVAVSLKVNMLLDPKINCGHYYFSCAIRSLHYKKWDPGKLLIAAIKLYNLEDKIVFQDWWNVMSRPKFYKPIINWFMSML